MNKIDVILKGGLQGCCSVYSAVELRRLTKDWFPAKYEVVFNILDVDEGNWETEKMGEFAYEQLGNNAFPLVYANNMLVALGGFPDRDVCLEFVKNTKPITKEVVLQFKKQMVEKSNV